MSLEKNKLNRKRIFQNSVAFLFSLQLFSPAACAMDTNHGSSIQVAVAAQSCSVTDGDEDTKKADSLPSAPVRAVTEADIARCLKDGSEVERVVHTGNSLVVDVRNSSQQLSHIAGTIAIPLYAVHGKGFIKDQNLVLLGNGVNDLQLASECVRLQKTGAKRVYVLKGGVRAWEEMKGQSGTVLQLSDKLITPQDIYVSGMNREWLILPDAASGVNDQEIRKLFPDSSVIAIDFGKGIRQILAKKKSAKFLVITADGQSYPSISAMLQGHKIQNDFYLEGGVAAYRQYLFTQQAYLRRMQEKAAKKKTLCGG